MNNVIMGGKRSLYRYGRAVILRFMDGKLVRDFTAEVSELDG